VADAGVAGAGAADAGVAGGESTDGGVADSGVAAGGVVVQDDFHRTGGLGPNWQVTFGAFSTNGTAAVGTVKPSYAFWNGPPSGDVTVAITVGPPLAATYYGVTAHANPAVPDRDHYAAYISPDGTVGLARRDDYAYTYLGTGPRLSGGAHRLSLTASGTGPVQLSVKLDGVEVIHASDGSSSARASGLSGIFDFNGTSQPLYDFAVVP
jgi:hypothetical protein